MPTLKQRRLLVASEVLASSLPYYFVTILIMKKLGFSYAEMGYLAVITQLFGMVFDLPMSLLTRRISEKRLLVISRLLMIVGFCLLIKPSFSLAVIAAICLGLSESLSSGIAQSFVYRQFEQAPSAYEDFLVTMSRWQYGVTALVTLVTPIFLSLSVYLPIIGSIGFVCLSLACLSFLPDRGVLLEGQVSRQKKVSLKGLWGLLLMGVVINNLIMVVNSYSTVLLDSRGFPLAYLGVILLLFNACMFIGGHIRFKSGYVVILPMLTLLAASQSSVWLLLGCLCLFRLFNASFKNYFSSQMNQSIDKDRAVIWSVYTFSISVTFILSDLISSQLAERSSIAIVYLMAGLLSLVFVSVWAFLTKKLACK